MFRKKPSAPQPRSRPSLQQPRNKIFSYHASRQTTETPRDRQPGFDLLPSKISSKINAEKLKYGAALLLLFAVIFINIFINTAKAPIITVQGSPKDRLLLKPKQVYADAARKLIQSTLSSRTKLTINTSHISDELLSKFPELQSATVSLPLLGLTPTITLTPNVGVFTYTSTHGQSFVLNTKGQAISTSTGAVDSLVPITDQSGLKVKLAEQALPSNDVAFLQTLQQQLDNNGIHINAMTLPAASREVDVKIDTKPYIVKFSLENDVQQQAGAYVAVQKKLDSGKVTPSQYIDARVGDRVYYK